MTRAASGTHRVAASALDSSLAPSGAQQSGRADPEPFLMNQLRFKFEALLLEAGEADTPAALKKRLTTLIGHHFEPADAARALALLERYVDYRTALGELKAPTDSVDPRALRQAVQARQQVREKHFAQDEYQALFAQDDALDRFTLARLETEHNATLTPAQKQDALREAERELGEGERAARADAVSHLAVATQTAAFDNQGVSDQERFAGRSAQYGDAAARQLAQLDHEERNWQGRLTEYNNARTRKLSAQQLEQLGRQLFSEQEQLRIEAALAARTSQNAATATR
jgi:lipase chaperone LimK